MKTLVTALAALTLAAQSDPPKYPGTPTIAVVTVRGGDFVTVKYQAGGFFRASEDAR
jgi:hypothetical protein